MPERILYLLKMPPPSTGATYMNSVVFNATKIDQAFDIRRIGISYASSVRELGRFRFRKFTVFGLTFIKLLWQLLFRRPRFVYFQPSLFGATYLRDLVFLLLGRLARMPFVLHFHGKGLAAVAAKSRVWRVLYRLGFGGHYAVVLSKNQRQDIAFLAMKKEFVVPNGIADMTMDLERKKESAGAFRFLFLSNLLRSKGLPQLLEAAVILKKTVPFFRLDLVGNEGDISVEELETTIGRLDLQEQVRYLGPKYGDEKANAFAIADAFVFPTRNDAFGLVVTEAMQFSLPVITTAEGAIPEMVEDGESGLICDGEPTSLASHMLTLMNDPEMARRMGKRGRMIYSEKFTNEKFIRNMTSVFAEVMNYTNQK